MTTMAETINAQPVFDRDNPAQIYDQLRGEITFQAVSMAGLVSGEINMPRPGRGFEVRSVRDYVIGDDVKHIDWNATARQPNQVMQIRDHNRDVTPSLYIVTDALQSRYESAATSQDYFSERDLAISACLGLIQLASRQNMPSTVIASNDENKLKPLNMGVGQSHRLKIARQMASNISTLEDPEALLKADAESEVTMPRLSELLKYAGSKASNSLVVLVSDFRDAFPNDQEAGWNDSLKALKRRNNTIMSVVTTSPADFVFPDHIRRPVTDRGVVPVRKNKAGLEFREQYKQIANQQAAEIAESLKAVGAREISLSTAEPRWIDSFKRQLKQQ
ncbi:MAG: hypothetical protein JWO69_1960 [Thermoleophilia bacterium]|nr:hypothetical protein [Thermoleophilia bacterium]